MEITLNITDDIAERAQDIASETGTTLGEITTALIAGFVHSFAAKDACTGNYRLLIEFALGKRSHHEVMRQLGITSDESLFMMMMGAGLPMPRLSDETTQAMADRLNELLGNNRIKPGDALRTHADRIIEIVEANKCTNARVFGSVARGEDTLSSDLDLIVDTIGQTTLFDIGRITDALETLLKVKVDVLTPGCFQATMLERVLAEAVPVTKYRKFLPTRVGGKRKVRESGQGDKS